jgi:hypothetical protein
MHLRGSFLKIEEDAVVAAAQPIIAIEICQPFDVAMQSVLFD